MALVSVVAVLVLLGLIVTPFVITMRDSDARGTRVLYSARVQADAETVFAQVGQHVLGTLESVEYDNLRESRPGRRRYFTTAPVGLATPAFDSRSEFELPDDLLDGFVRQTPYGTQVWQAELIDQQALFDVNGCSYPVLANLIGRARLAADIDPHDTSLHAAGDLSMFPEKNGLIRVGGEVMRYARRTHGEFLDCERGFRSDLPENGRAMHWEAGDLIVSEAAFQIATRPYRVRPGSYVRYTNPYQLRQVAEMGIASLTPEQFDALRPFVTTWNGNVAGDGWTDPQPVRNGILARAEGPHLLELRSTAFYGPGTVVKITDGAVSDFGVVIKVVGDDQILVAGDVRHSYGADRARIYSRSRSPLNVNTASGAQLVAALRGLRLRGSSNDVSEREAVALVEFLLAWTSVGQEEPGVFPDWGSFVTALEVARNEHGLLDDDEYEAVLRNGLNANDSRLGFGTVPFCFRSFDLYEVRATVALQDRTGRETARRHLRRVIAGSSARSEVWTVESQEDFQRHIAKTRDGKWFTTYPHNVNAHPDGRAIPASEYEPFAHRDRFPSTARTAAEGDVRLLPARYDFHLRPDRYFHFDGSDLHDGLDIGANTLSHDLEGPYDVGDNTIGLVERVEVEDEEYDLGLREFTVSFLYKPDWERGGGDQVIFDHGLDLPDVNRVALLYDDRRDALVLRCASPALDRTAAEVVYDFDDIEWEREQWYHIGVEVGGEGPDLLALFIDGERVGVPSHVTRLTRGIQGDGEVTILEVEDASTFPNQGVLLLQSEFGIELIEYGSRSKKAFFVHRRKARTIDTADLELEFRPHPTDTVVRLYGFSGILQSDLTSGGARLPGDQGPWRMFRMVSRGDLVRACFLLDAGADPPPGAVESTDCPQPPEDSDQVAYEINFPGLVHVDDHEPVIRLLEWDTEDEGEEIRNDLGPVGTEGIAMVASPRATVDIDDDGDLEVVSRGNDPDASVPAGADPPRVPNVIGGVDFVRYRVESISEEEGLTVRLLERGLDLRHVGSSQWMRGTGEGRFIPTYSYGAKAEDDDPLALKRDPSSGGGGGGQSPLNQGPVQQELGFWTAFVPLGLVGRGSDVDYLDPMDAEPQLDDGTGDRYAYVQIGTEWVKYDTFDERTVPGHVVFYRDTVIHGVIDELFENVVDGLSVFPAADTPSERDPGGGDGPDQGGLAPPGRPDTNFPRFDPYVPGSGEDGLTQPPTPGTGEPEYLDPPVAVLDFAVRLDFRGALIEDDEHLIANTRPRDHEEGDSILPAFRMQAGDDVENGPAARGAYPGYNDLLTLRSWIDDEYAAEQIRVLWGYRGWAAPTEEPIRTWGWDRHDTSPSMKTMRISDPRLWTRALKFPSSEMPDSELTQAEDGFVWSRSFDGEISSSGVIDELTWPKVRMIDGGRPPRALLGEVPDELLLFMPHDEALRGQLSFQGIDDEQDEIRVHGSHYRSNPEGATIRELVHGYPILETFDDDAGILRIDDELIFYNSWDEDDGVFKGCQRGVLGTEPRAHAYGARVQPVRSFPTTVLLADVDEDDAYFEFDDLSDFPDAGYLRIADGDEIVGYTRHDVEGVGASRESQSTAVLHPLRRLASVHEREREEDDDARSGGGLFRGRFATVPESYVEGDVAIFLPFRVWDRYADRSDDPENAYVQLAWNRPGGIWKRVTWNEVPEELTEVLGFLRFAGGPAWDTPDVIQVGQEPLPKQNPSRFVYQINRPEDLNLLNIESDRLELRLMVRFAEGAYDRRADVRPNHWKNSPWVQRVRVELVAPPRVLYQE